MGVQIPPLLRKELVGTAVGGCFRFSGTHTKYSAVRRRGKTTKQKKKHVHAAATGPTAQSVYEGCEAAAHAPIYPWPGAD